MKTPLLKDLDKDTAVKYNVEENTLLKEIPFESHEEWLTVRKATIGGSDIGVVLGLNEYKSKLQLYKEKTSDTVTETSSMFTKKGTDLEDFILRKWVIPDFDAKGYDVYKPNKMFVRKDNTDLSANLDGLAVPRKRPGKNIGVEIKWVSMYGTNKWEQEAAYGYIPPSYYAQVQQYMYVMDIDEFYVYALFDDTWDYKTYIIERNEAFIERLKNAANLFLKYHVNMGIPPKPEMGKDSADIAEMLSHPAKETKTDVEFDDLIAKYLAVKRSAKEISARENELLSDILNKTLEGYVPSTDKFKVKFTTCTTTRLDTEKLKENLPEVYKQYLKQSTYTRSTIK